MAEISVEFKNFTSYEYDESLTGIKAHEDIIFNPPVLAMEVKITLDAPIFNTTYIPIDYIVDLKLIGCFACG